jgi:nicotinamidase-related amidase
MDLTQTAVVLVEYQNEFTSKGGTLHDTVKGSHHAELRVGHL